MRNWKIDNILSLLKEAGALALASWSAPEVELKADQTVVTNADRAIEQRFAEAFDRPAAGSFMIGEESVGTRTEEYLDEALRGICHVVDPIDGTAPYSAHVPLWGISVGAFGLASFSNMEAMFGAASAALASVEATTLSGMPPGKESPAHTEEDTPDKVSEETLSRAIAIGIIARKGISVLWVTQMVDL